MLGKLLARASYDLKAATLLPLLFPWIASLDLISILVRSAAPGQPAAGLRSSGVAHFVARDSPPATLTAAGWPFNGLGGLS